MPGDSLLYLRSGGDTVILTESNAKHIHISHFQPAFAQVPDDGSLWVFAIFLLLFVFRILFPTLRLQYLQKQRIRKTLLAIDERGEQYNAWLQQYNFFYRKLNGEGKKRFLQRTVEFMRSKRFIYHDLEPEEKMELLISSAAIQITFGLDQYLLEYFRKIHILKNDYLYGLYNRPFMGHVNSDGIFLSWNNFISGYENYTDANNVGLHEMAHALAYENFMTGEDNGEAAFQRRFAVFSKTARPIFNKMKDGETNFLRSLCKHQLPGILGRKH
jgi:Mlc titration factor MtfA (ptsG expression regulator)